MACPQGLAKLSQCSYWPRAGAGAGGCSTAGIGARADSGAVAGAGAGTGAFTGEGGFSRPGGLELEREPVRELGLWLGAVKWLELKLGMAMKVVLWLELEHWLQQGAVQAAV